MNQKTKLTILTGVNFAVNAALSMGAQAGTMHHHPINKTDNATGSNNRVLQADTNEFEASFLEVSKSCKVSNPAFDAVSVGLENISPDVISIHAEIETA